MFNYIIRYSYIISIFELFCGAEDAVDLWTVITSAAAALDPTVIDGEPVPALTPCGLAARDSLRRVDFEGGYATYDSATGKVDVKTNEKGNARNNAVQAGTTAGDSDIAAAASSANNATSATPTAAATATGSEAAGEDAAHTTTGATGDTAAGNAEPTDADIPVTTEE